MTLYLVIQLIIATLLILMIMLLENTDLILITLHGHNQKTDFNLYARKKNKKIYVLCFKNTGIFPTRAYQALKPPSLVFDKRK